MHNSLQGYRADERKDLVDHMASVGQQQSNFKDLSHRSILTLPLALPSPSVPLSLQLKMHIPGVKFIATKHPKLGQMSASMLEVDSRTLLLTSLLKAHSRCPSLYNRWLWVYLRITAVLGVSYNYLPKLNLKKIEINTKKLMEEV